MTVGTLEGLEGVWPSVHGCCGHGCGRNERGIAFERGCRSDSESAEAEWEGQLALVNVCWAVSDLKRGLCDLVFDEVDRFSLTDSHGAARGR